MGLLDILTGMANGPRGPAAPKTNQSTGMSPMTMGLLALLAYKAYKSGSLGNILGGNSPSPTSPTAPPPPTNTPSPPTSPSANTGGLEDWLRNTLGGAVTGNTTGNVVNGGLTELVKRFQQSGLGPVADSWVKTGPNKPISPNDLAKAAGADDLDTLAKEMNVPRDQLLARLSDELPGHVDALTPNGRIGA